jgi:hypothetical protein
MNGREYKFKIRRRDAGAPGECGATRCQVFRSEKSGSKFPGFVLNFCRADLRIRIDRRQLRRVWREVYLAPTAFRQATYELSRVQEAGAQNHFHVQFPDQTKAAFYHGREKSRVYGPQTG